MLMIFVRRIEGSFSLCIEDRALNYLHIDNKDALLAIYEVYNNISRGKRFTRLDTDNI